MRRRRQLTGCSAAIRCTPALSFEARGCGSDRSTASVWLLARAHSRHGRCCEATGKETHTVEAFISDPRHAAVSGIRKSPPERARSQLSAVSTLTLAFGLFGCAQAPDSHSTAEPAEIAENAILSDGSVSRANLERDVGFLAQAPRFEGSAHLGAARDYCADRLTELGYYVQRKSIAGGRGENVFGWRLGTSIAQEQVLISAHVDSVANCDGADDNASGVAGVLEAARILAQEPHARTLVLACWDLEEAGLLGSLDYAAEAKSLGENIRTSIVLEMIGYKTDEPNSQQLPVPPELEPAFQQLFPDQYKFFVENQRRGNFISLLGDAPGGINPAGARDFMAAFQSAAADIQLGALPLELTPDLVELLPDVTRSDHAAFWSQGYSAVMITDTANLRNPNYHCLAEANPDVIPTLDFDFATDVTQAAVAAAMSVLDQ
jgi:hypothetical protein